MPLWTAVWLEFSLCLGLLGVAGTRLIHHCDELASRSGLSRHWLGLILVATVTSLPELATGLSSVLVARAPDLAVGDVLGSCQFNLAILAAIDLAYRGRVLTIAADRQHLIAASHGAVLLAATALVLLLGPDVPWSFPEHVGWGTWVLVVLYAVAVRSNVQAERSRRSLAVAGPGTGPARSAWNGCALWSAVVVTCGVWLPVIGLQLAEVMGWSDSMVGTLLVALATSVPEVATTLAALRIGAVDMAVGGLLGSNLFDVLILAIDDLVDLQGPLYARVSPLHAITAINGSMMSAVVALSLLHRREAHPNRKGRLRVGAVMLVLYLFNSTLQMLN